MATPPSSRATSRRRKRGALSVPVALVTALIVIGAVALGIGKLWDAAHSATSTRGCTIGSYSLDLDQTNNASVMVSVVLKRELPERAAVLTLAAALQESKLRNVAAGDGDRDSVGILQQRPSQGWGTPQQIADVHYATGKFLDALVQVADWRSLPLAEAIQQVQRSADGSAYAGHEGEAQTMADALSGVTPAGLSCSFTAPTEVAAPAAVAAQLASDLPVQQPQVSGPDIRVPGAAWATAAWLVSHADSYGVDSVRYAGQQWTRRKGWKPYGSAELGAVTASMATAKS